MGTDDDTKDVISCKTCKYGYGFGVGEAMSLLIMECCRKDTKKYKLIGEVCEHYEK